ncbi:hypothetical protein [Saccharicrinis sp. GN24d3]|uniref:hypothetical protein n=1 Tax=Saccharicrinis sp. GN24d3 TaxID=3458416 RepID=UPI004036DA19
MQRFLKNILLFAVIFFVLDKIFILFLLISPSLEKDRRIEKLVEGEINKDIIILGSSRGARNVIASQIEDSIGMPTYNLSYPGSDVTFHEFLLKTLIKYNSRPKIVFLVLDDPEELLPSVAIKFRFDRLYPLVKYNYINDEMIHQGEKTILSRFFALARANKRNFDLRARKFSALDSLKDCGSMPVSFQRTDRSFYYNPINEPYIVRDEVAEKVMAFQKIQDICAGHGIELVLVFSPNFKAYNVEFEDRLKKISHPGIQFFVYDTLNPVYKDKSYYYDESHLQTNGAIVFTNELIKVLKEKGVGFSSEETLHGLLRNN